jgi:polysaccharide export outer membrane protein
VLLSVVLAAPLSAQHASTSSVAHDSTEATAGVRPGDVIRLWVWREESYSGEFAVDARGWVVLPLLGEVMVPGKTAEQLADTLRDAYRKYLNNRSIQVTVLRRVAVQGEVAKPGLYPADATITISDLISLAGGVTQHGNQKKIRLVRGGRVIVSGLGPGTVLQRSPVESGDQVYVPQKSWLARNSSTFLWGGITVAGAVLVRYLTQ